MANESQVIKNLNHIRLHELESFFRNEISKFNEDSRLRKHFSDDVSDFSKIFEDIKAHPEGNKLICMEDEFNYHFEAFMKPVDVAMNVMVDDLFYDFSAINMTTEEGLMQMPDFAAARSLMPPRDDNDDKYICHCEGDLFGQVWPVEDIPLLMKWISKDENRIHAEYLGVGKARDTLVSVFNSIEKHVELFKLRDKLEELRKHRWGISLAMPLVFMELYPDIRYHEMPRHIDPRDIVHPILATRAEQELMAEFSFNDLSHDSFLSMAKQIVNQRKSIESLNDKIEEDLLGDFELYNNAVGVFKKSNRWNELQEFESSWYRESERFLLTIKFSVESYDADDPKRWKKHEESDRFQSAVALWEMLPHNPFESLWFIRRGDLISESQWKVMRSNFSEINEQEMLKDIGALKIYEDCLAADNEARSIAAEIVENGKEAHHELRKTRKRLTAVLNFIQHLAEKEKKSSNIKDSLNED